MAMDALSSVDLLSYVDFEIGSSAGRRCLCVCKIRGKRKDWRVGRSKALTEKKILLEQF